MDILLHAAIMIALALALGWVIERITGEYKRKAALREYWSLKSELDNMERINRCMEGTVCGGKEKQGD
jgi:hypothetical protein